MVDIDKENLVSEVEKIREKFKNGIEFKVVEVKEEKEVEKEVRMED